MADDATHQCSGCGQIKPAAEFDPRSDSPRRRSRCKACRRAYQNARNGRARPTVARPRRVAGSADLHTCTRCRRLLPADAFPRRCRDGDRLQTWCRGCFSSVKAANYARERERVKERVRRYRRQVEVDLRRRLETEFGDASCTCGEARPSKLRLVDAAGRAWTLRGLARSGRSLTRVETMLASIRAICSTCIAQAAGKASKTRRTRPARQRTRPIPPPGATDGLRRCGRCGITKSVDEFVARYRDAPRPSSWCRACRAAYHRTWYEQNRESVIARVAVNRSRESRSRTINHLAVRRLRWEYLLAHPCVDCGQSDPIVLQFDHRGEKSSDISDLLQRSATWSEIMLEIEKCDVRCGNCHRRRTAMTRGYYRDLLDPTARERAAVARRRRWEYLLAHPCVDCGERDPLVLEFDHRSGKRAAISALMGDHATWPTVIAEIEKCDVRCANCHKRRTAQTAGHYFEIVERGLRRLSEAAA